MSWPVDHTGDGAFGADNLPYGSFTVDGGPRRLGVRVGDHVLCLSSSVPDRAPGFAELVSTGTLDAVLAAGRPTWTALRAAVTDWLTDTAIRPTLARYAVPLDRVRLHRAFTVADYVDFYASEHHATNVGRILRPGTDALSPNWRHLPIGYHGRAGTVVVTGTDVVRPRGQFRAPDGSVRFGPSQRLDIEAEVAFVIGVGSAMGTPVRVTDFAEHVFGVCLLNDWSARDIQAFEYVPLGPFLGKSFATSVSAWITPLDALAAARIAAPPRDPVPMPYLDDLSAPWGLDLALEVTLDGAVVSHPPFASMYWTPAQMLAHLTVNGASVRTGDLFASGTVSGPAVDERGSLLELTWNGTQPLTLADGSTRGFLADGDEVVLTATAPGTSGGRIALGEVRGRIAPARH